LVSLSKNPVGNPDGTSPSSSSSLFSLSLSFPVLSKNPGGKLLLLSSETFIRLRLGSSSTVSSLLLLLLLESSSEFESLSEP